MSTSNRRQEAKWRRMKRHIAGSARRLGKRGDEFRRYVYGAMRARGWKPKRERVTENVNAVMRQNIDTNYGHNALHGSVDRSFKNVANKRRGVVKFNIPEDILSRAHQWLQEVYATDLVPTNLPVAKKPPSPKQIVRSYKRGLTRGVVHPLKSMRLAARQLQTANRTEKAGNAVHAAVQRRRAVILGANRLGTLTGAAGGMGAAFILPGSQGGAGVAAATGAAVANKGTRWLRKNWPK